MAMGPCQRTLAFRELSEWELTLHSGDVIVIYADSKGEESGYYVFNIAVDGSPISLLPVARIPVKLVSDYRTTHVGVAGPLESGPEESQPDP